MSKSKLLNGGSTAQIIELEDHRKALSVDELAQRTAAPSRAEGKAKTKAAVGELVEAGREQIVLGHIHPGWLRNRVAELLDAGIHLGPKGIEEVRKVKAEHWSKMKAALIASRVTGKPANVG